MLSIIIINSRTELTFISSSLLVQRVLSRTCHAHGLLIHIHNLCVQYMLSLSPLSESSFGAWAAFSIANFPFSNLLSSPHLGLMRKAEMKLGVPFNLDIQEFWRKYGILTIWLLYTWPTKLRVRSWFSNLLDTIKLAYLLYIYIKNSKMRYYQIILHFNRAKYVALCQKPQNYRSNGV